MSAVHVLASGNFDVYYGMDGDPLLNSVQQDGMEAREMYIEFASR